ncbi:MAG: hypothetical protein Q8O22_07935, partial [Candidatus Omnitrophota bacterium]|nr:hypothetical protein [Candidatus Omnitrophota bacterium]
MNIKEIKEMICLMNDNGLVELEIEKDGMRIRLKKTSSAQDGSAGPIIVEKQAIPQATSKLMPEQAPESIISTIEIKAPMVGTFYRAPSPEASVYAEVGQVIEP